MKKRIVCMLCVLSCLILMAGCSLTKENKNLKESKLTENAEAFVDQWFSYDFSGTVEQYSDQLASEQVEEYKNYAKMQKKHGAMKKIEKSEYSLASDSASVAVTVSTEKSNKLTFTVNYDKNGEVSDWKVEDYKSISEIMGKAGLNTVMCMAIVFLVLIFIALLISCFKFIGKAQGSGAKAQPETEAAPVPAPAPVVEEDLTDDLELVAVITAAIAAASETESADGLVVRSIVRRS